MKRFQRRPGFTLIELIVVLVILAILAAAGLPALSGYIQNAKETTAISECGTVVRTAQARAVELLAFERLNELPHQAEKASIMEACGLPGEIRALSADAASGSITYLLYECKNGLLVQYKPEEEPKFTIVKGGGSGGDPTPTPLEAMEAWVKTANDLTLELGAEKTYLDRDAVIAEMKKRNGLFQVDPAYTAGAQWANLDAPLYWRPYYLGSLKAPVTIMYANGNTSDSKDWNAKLLYVNGAVYRAPDNKNYNIALFKDFSGYDKVLDWLTTNNFEIVTP